jgi:hypothetical protein
MASTPTDISARTTHDLWVDARQFTLDITRPTPTSIQLTVKRPASLQVTDGAVVLLSEKPISASNYPKDGVQYAADVAPDWATPIQKIGEAHVVGAYYGIMDVPFPATEETEANAQVTGYPSTFESFTITVQNTNASKIYYASVHAASNVLQYYPIGVQSYPLEGSQSERNSSAYSGNIPSYPTAPTAPVPGMVYHDEQLNIVQYYDGVSGSWIPTRADSIVSGPYNPGILGQVYLYAANQLKVFNGKIWVDASPLNMQVRSNGTWVPLGRVTATTTTPTAPNLGDMFYDYTLERVHYWDGTTWVYPNSTNVLFNTGSGLVPAFVTGMTVEAELLRPPYVGQLFYNQTTRELNAWNGTSWNKVNTDQEGTPTTDKISIGTDGSYDERIRLIKVLNNQLGWPQLCVELQEEQFNIAIDNALDNYRQLSDGAYRRGFVIYKLIPNQQLYYLNSAIDKSNTIVDIHKVHRMGPLGTFGGGPNDVWSQAFAQQFYNLSAGHGDLLSTHLVASYGEELQRMFAGDLMFQWHEATRELFFTRAIRNYETVIIECMLERSEQEILLDRWCKQFIQNWALAELKMTLGLIRSKFSSGTPGPGGTINLNGELLVSEARQDMIELKEELLNYEYGGHVGSGNVSFLFG